MSDALDRRGLTIIDDGSNFGRGTAVVPLRLNCPDCGTLHIDEGEFATKPHHTHSCQVCGLTWRPAIVYTVGVQFLPGFKNKEAP